MQRSLQLFFVLICLSIRPAFSIDSLQTALKFHQSSKFDKALPIFIALSKKFKAKNDFDNYALCQVKIADMIRNYGGANIALQLLETNQRFIKIKGEVPSRVLSQNFIAQAEAFYANSNLREFKTAILKSMKVKYAMSLPERDFIEDYFHLARYYLDMPDQNDSCFYWAAKALKLTKADKAFSTYLLPKVYNLFGYYFHPKSLAYFKDKGDSVKWLFNISRLYYDSALSSIKKQPLTDELTKSMIYHNIGNSFSNEGSINKALYYYRLSLSVIEKFGSPTDLVNKDWVIGRAFQRSHLNDSAIAQLQKGIVRLIPNFKPLSVDEIPSLQPTINDHWFSSLLILKADNYLNRYQHSKKMNDLQLAFDHYLHSLKFNRYLVSKSTSEGETIHWTYLYGSNSYQRLVGVGYELFEKTGNKDYIKSAYSLIASSKYAFLNKDIIESECLIPNTHLLLERERTVVTDKILRNIPEITESILASILPPIEETGNRFPALDFEAQLSEETTLANIATELSKENAALIDFYVLGDVLYTITITETGFAIRSKYLSGNTIESIKRLNKNLLRITPREFAIQSNEIYRKILDSVLMHVPQKISRLIFCPDQVLQEVAWESLTTDTINSNQFKTINYLMRKYAIRTVLKPSQMISRNLEQTENYFGIAPDFTNSKRFTSIPFSTNLVAVKAKDLNGVVSTSLSRDSISTNIFHIASHINIDSVHPYNSIIALNGDSILVGNIPNLKVNANLVVLNGCQTGSGKYVQSEGSMSVARAFCLIGAKSLITTLWNVDDKASADLLAQFYDNIERGKELDIALQNAKLDFIDQSSSDDLANPFYWSGVQLTGSANPVMKASNSGLFWYASILVTLVFVGFLKFKKRILFR